MTEQRTCEAINESRGDICGKPAKYRYQPVAGGSELLCGLHARRLYASRALKWIGQECAIVAHGSKTEAVNGSS